MKLRFCVLTAIFALTLSSCYEPSEAESAVRILALGDDFTNSEVDVAFGQSLALNANLAFGVGDIFWTVAESSTEAAVIARLSPAVGETVTITAGNTSGSAVVYARLENTSLPEESALSYIKVNVVEVVAISSVNIADEKGAIVSGKTLSLKIGQTAALQSVVKPVTASADVTWDSSDLGVASVSAVGLVTALAEGTTEILLSAVNRSDSEDQKEASLTIKVLKDEPITGLTLKYGNAAVTSGGLTMNSGEKIVLEAVAAPAGVNANITWKSSDTGVASVSAGEVTGVGTGTVTISAEAVNTVTTEPVKASVEITVLNPKLYWVWKASDGITGTLTTGAGAQLNGTGTGGAWLVNVRKRDGGNITVDGNGITIDATQAGGGVSGMLVIGEKNPAAAEDSTASSCPEGVFDLSAQEGMKVTVNIDVLTAGQGTRSFSVFLNNSTATTAYTPLSSATEARLVYLAPPTIANSGAQSKSFVPSTFKQDYIDTLSKAFLGIVQYGLGSGNYGAKVLIKSIIIEYQ